MTDDPKRQLEAFFRDQMRVSYAEAPSFEELTAYVEGRLGPEERALLEERLAADPGLGQEVEDLRALHAQMARPRRTAIRALPLRYGLAAAAAVAAIALVALWPRPGREGGHPGPPVTLDQARIPILTDGDLRVARAADGSIEGLSSLDPGMRDAVAAALRGTLPTSAGLAALQPAGSNVLGTEDAPAFALVSPRGTRILTDRPTFRWTALPSARTYEVAVFDPDLRKQVASGPVTATEWTPARPLPRGRTYLWQVTAFAGGRRVTVPAPPAPEARFEVADPDVLTEVEARRAQAPTSRLVAALADVQAGLLDDAEAELRALAADNPQSPELARLRGTLESLRRSGPSTPR
jgi:hypothetical protein